MRNRDYFQWPAMLLMLFLVFTSCEKRTTPKKVQKHLTEGTWKIGQAKINGSNVTSAYNGVKFAFSGSGTIAVSGEIVTQGTWSLGTDKNPVLMVMSFPPSATVLYGFSDDWLITEMSKWECTMKRSDMEQDVLVFRRID